VPARAAHRLRLVAVIGVLVTGAALGAAACGGGGDHAAARPTTGRGIYKAYCLTCHGVDGQGGVGPQLAGVVVEKYPNIDDQIAVVTNGRGGMPSFASTLSPEEIRKVVTYERTDLGR
jgi:mono/diheme cytochrome c family protein